MLYLSVPELSVDYQTGCGKTKVDHPTVFHSFPSFFLFPNAPLNLVAAAVDHNSIPSNITVGSSLSASPDNITSYLLSPSGTFAFGFKPLDNQYKVCIWIANSSDKTIVWVPDRDHDESVDRGSSILLNHDGVFVLQKPGNQSLPLLNNSTAPTQPAFSALILDTGNLAIYNNRSEIIWQSFDYPTDTILAGQTLKSGHYLIATS